MARSKSVGRTAWRRGLVVAVLLGVVVLAGSCKTTLGCRVVSLGEPGTPTLLYVDDSACETPPTPVVPEVPFAILLPLVGGAAVVLVARRQVTRRRREVGSA